MADREGKGKEKERTVVDSRKTGEFLAALRKAAGYTQQEAADYLAITNKTVSKWESGAGMPEVGILPAVAELYDVTVDELLAGHRLEEKKPEAMRSRRRWLVEAQERRLHNGLIVVWCTVTAGYAVLFGLYNGLRETDYTWVTVTYGVVWLLLEIMGIGLFYNQLRHNISVAAKEAEESAGALRLCLHSCRMRLVLPLILAAVCVLPLVWMEPFVLPADLPAPFAQIQAAEDMSGLVRLLANEWGGYNAADLNDALVCVRLNGAGLLLLLPPVLLSGSMVWEILRLLGIAVIEKKSSGVWKNIACLLLCGTVLFSALFAGGRRFEQNRSVYSETFESQASFDSYVQSYLEVYDAFRAYDVRDGGTDWPNISYGTEIVDPSFLDSRLIGASYESPDRYEDFIRVIGFDYEERIVYKVRTGRERLAEKGQWNFISGSVCLAGLAVFWGAYAVRNHKNRKDGSEAA